MGRECRRFTDGEAASAREMFRAGKTLAEIADALGRTVPSVTHFLRKEGFTRYRSRKESRKKGREAVRMRRAGFSYAAIEEATGLDRQRLYRVFCDAGMTRRKTPPPPIPTLGLPDWLARDLPPAFPETDDFELEPPERERLEEVRRKRVERWHRVHKKRKFF